MKILLGSKEYLKAVDKDFQFGFGLKNSKNFYQETDISKIIDELSQFNIERNSSYNYVLYGKMEYLIDQEINNPTYFLNQTNYDISVGYIDRYVPLVDDMINITGIVDGYLILNNKTVQLNDVIFISEGSTFNVNKVLERFETDGVVQLKLDNMSGITTNSKIVPSVAKYNRYFKELVKTDYLRIFNSGYSVNIFDDPIYQYNTFKNINTAGLKDNFNNPITDLIFRIKPKYASNNIFKSFPPTLISDDLIIDKVIYDLNNLSFTIIDEIAVSFRDNNTMYQFKPYYKNTIRVMSSVATNSNVDNLFMNPENGFKFNNGDVVYKNVLEIGSFEGELGVDYPFINNLQYVYNDIKFLIRRVNPVADYNNLNQGANDKYADDLVNDDITTKRLC